LVTYTSGRNEMPFSSRFLKRRLLSSPLPFNARRPSRRARVWRYASGAFPYQKYDGIALPSYFWYWNYYWNTKLFILLMYYICFIII